jgi:LysM repeat protein
MSHNAETSRQDNLVLRYAARKHAQHMRVIPEVRSGRQQNGIQTFGRTPITKRRAGSARSKQAVTTLMATAIMATATPAVTSAESSSYEVQSGDTLTQIAGMHDLSVDELIGLNSISNPDSIHPGDELSLSGEIQEEDATEVQEGDTIYQIQEGDTLFAIARDHDVSLEDLLALNEINESDDIYVDDFLIIPTSSVDADEGLAEPQNDQDEPEVTDDVDINDAPIVSLHLVARGETPGSVAQRYGLTVDQLMAANDLDNGDAIEQGTMLRIPDASWDPFATPAAPAEEATAPAAPAEEATAPADAETGRNILHDMPWHQQSMTQSSGPAAASIATSFWGHQVSEWVFIENMPSHQNPHRGYRGDMSAAPGGTSDYGVYPKPLSTMLANYGFVGDEFYTMGDPEALRDRIDQGQPVLVWMTEGATPQNRHFEWYQGERFTLVPHAQVVVAYGYDDDQIYVSDPATGGYATYSWEAFINSWSLFDGMSMAVYPKG